MRQLKNASNPPTRREILHDRVDKLKSSGGWEWKVIISTDDEWDQPYLSHVSSCFNIFSEDSDLEFRVTGGELHGRRRQH